MRCVHVVYVNREVTPSYHSVRLFFAVARGAYSTLWLQLSAGPATSRKLLLIGELEVEPPQQSSRMILIRSTRFPSGKRLGEWRKNETKSIQRETNTTTPEIEE